MHSGLMAVSGPGQNMMISGNSAGLSHSNLAHQNDYKMKHNNSNQSIHSQKKGGIAVIRKPGPNGSLDNSFSNQGHIPKNSSYKYMSPYSKNIAKKGIH